MRALLSSLGLDVKPNGVMYCPFHDNKNTPSAHIYQEKDGSNTIYCFSENRVFTNVDLYKTYLPDIVLDDLAQLLFSKLSEEQQKSLTLNLQSTSLVNSIPYIDSLDKFKFGKITFSELLKDINKSIKFNDTSLLLSNLYNVGTKLSDDSNKYMRFISQSDYKFLSAFTILSNSPLWPDYLVSYVSSHGDSVMIPNIIGGRVYSISLRNNQGSKQFLKIGNVSEVMYNLGNLPDSFRFGDTILLVEGNLDCDFIKQFYPNTLALLTDVVSNNQLTILKRLTTKVILALDNDDAGNKGYWISKKKLEEEGISVVRFTHNDRLKDFGDLLDLSVKDPNEYAFILALYKSQLSTL
jgi:5S rRNA maturation endonuclease (ribonuclease M5)